MSQSTTQHRKESPSQVHCAVVTVSDTRTLEDDRGGAMIVEYLESAGHVAAAREIVPDDPKKLCPLLTKFANDETIGAVLVTGGTGITARDQTFEALSELFDKTMPGYGELFRMLSWDEIGPASMLSRAIGGLIGTTIVLSMPGSTAAVRLAMEKLIVPEIAHLVYEANKQNPK